MRSRSDQPAHVAAIRLAAYSFLILFFELALIRYVPAYVRIIGFYLNFVLIAAFLGIDASRGGQIEKGPRMSALKEGPRVERDFLPTVGLDECANDSSPARPHPLSE